MPYKCELCNDSFAFPSHLVIHKRTHISKGQQSDTSEILEYESQKKTQENLNKCKHCGKPFQSP